MTASRLRMPRCARPMKKSASRRPRSMYWVASREVERLIEVPIALLREPERVQWEERTRILPPKGVMNVPYFAVPDARVWGATAMVLAEFVALVEEVEKSH